MIICNYFSLLHSEVWINLTGKKFTWVLAQTADSDTFHIINMLIILETCNTRIVQNSRDGKKKIQTINIYSELDLIYSVLIH